MKLRILNNSIRLRLSRAEVETANSDGLVRGRTSFVGGKSFEYVFESSPATVTPEARLIDNALTVRVPQIDVQEWAESERVSMRSEQLLDDGGQLSILIEKDFACLAPRQGEDESDMFPHPEARDRPGKAGQSDDR